MLTVSVGMKLITTDMLRSLSQVVGSQGVVGETEAGRGGGDDDGGGGGGCLRGR